jgi:glycosyltransferase involved in cell wall biosynthesis
MAEVMCPVECRSMSRRISVCVFACNEAASIADSLAALMESGLGPEDQVHVVVNGSSDATDDIARNFAARDGRVSVHVLGFGDKANAWNHYVHRIADDGAHHVFMDGDVRPGSGAIGALCAALDDHADALAASALPRGGRRSPAWARQILENHGMPGNLYMLRDTTVARMRARRFFLPVGLVGDDTFLRWMLLRDLDPSSEIRKDRIRPAALACFEYDSFPVASFSGLRALYKRHRRYSRRDMEMELLTEHLAGKGLAALPRYISELYPNAKLTSALRGGRRLRQVFFLSSYAFARRNGGRIPRDDPWQTVFSTR